MKSLITVINDNGEIVKKAIYTLSPKEALVAYVELYVNNNGSTWTYKDSKVHSGIKKLKLQNGYSYLIPDTNIVICATEQDEIVVQANKKRDIIKGLKFNETTAKQEFEKLKIKHKYIINLNQIKYDSVIRASSLLNRISWAKQDFSNFNNKIILSENIKMKEECSEIFLKLQDKYWKLDDILSKIKVSIEFI